MGIPGFTTYINNRDHIFLRPYELHDQNLVIDGNNVAMQLYSRHTRSHECFGCDYDKVAKVYHHFFRLLETCNITPYIVFDGGYETRKLKTIHKRLHERLERIEKINVANDRKTGIFPLFVTNIFREICLKLKLKIVQCDHEADNETAFVARTLNCPVLSMDSDYFIFDVTYIPFNTFDMDVRRKIKSYYYITCKGYKVDFFLQNVPGFQRDNMALLPVFLGNDYIAKETFDKFFMSLPMVPSREENVQQIYINQVIKWLQYKSIESAVKTIVRQFKPAKRRQILQKIHAIINGYFLENCYVLQYLEVEPKNLIKPPKLQIDVDQLDQQSKEEEQLDYETDEEIESSSSNLASSDFFLQQYRKVLLPSNFMDVVSLGRIYLTPLLDNFKDENSYESCMDLVSACASILTNSNETKILFFGRTKNGDIPERTLPACPIKLPYFEEIKLMSQEQTKKIFLKLLGVDTTFVKFTEKCPQSWTCYLLTIRFLQKKLAMSLPCVYSLILCLIVTRFIDYMVGFQRSIGGFMSEFSKSNITESNVKATLTSTIPECFREITQNDAFYCQLALIQYFELNWKTCNNPEEYHRDIIHELAIFQSTLMYVKHLNSILNYPFGPVIISDFYNGTFLYNMILDLRTRNLDTYLDVLLGKSGSVLNIFKQITSNFIVDNTDSSSSKKQKKKKKKKKKSSSSGMAVCTEQVQNKFTTLRMTD